MSLMYRAVHEPPDLAVVPPELREAVASCLAKSPSARPAPSALLDLLTLPAAPPAALADRVPTAYARTVSVPRPPVSDAAPEIPSPAIMAADHEASIAADGDGIVFRLDGTEAEFEWSEIAAIEYTASRRGRQLVVRIGLYDGASYTCEVSGRRKADVDEWLGQLDLVVDRHFDA